MNSRRRSGRPAARTARGFTLLEVMLALVIATIGVTYLYEGLALSLVAQERERFFHRCSWFLESELEGKLPQLFTPGATVSGTVGSDWPRLDYKLASEASPDVKGLIVATITFTSIDAHSPHVATLKTYLTPQLKTRKPEKPKAGP